MEQMEFITEHFGIKRYRSVAAVCAIYPDAHTVETYLYLKLTSFCVHILIIVLVRVLILVKLTFWTAISAHQVIISVSVGTENIPRIGWKHEEPSQHPTSCHYRPVGETPFEWRFAGGPIVARFYVLTGKWAGIGLAQPSSNLVPLSARR